MNSAANRPTSKQMSRPLAACALLAILLPSLLLTGCASGSSVDKASLPVSSALYQPPVLRIYQGQEIQTRDGIYRPQRDEVWHSDARYRQLEQENLDLVAALAAERRRK